MMHQSNWYISESHSSVNIPRTEFLYGADKVMIYKSRGEVSLEEQPTIDCAILKISVFF